MKKTIGAMQIIIPEQRTLRVGVWPDFLMKGLSASFSPEAFMWPRILYVFFDSCTAFIPPKGI
jgi:hypothetical protein